MTAAIAPVVGAISSASLGTMISVASAIFGGISTMSAYNAQAEIDAKNAENAIKNSQNEALRAQQEAHDKDMAARAELGMLLAEQSASGLGLNSGSFALARKSKEQLATQDRQRISDAGYNNVKSYVQQAEDFAAKAKSNIKAGSNALISSAFKATGSLLDGAASVNRRKAASLLN